MKQGIKWAGIWVLAVVAASAEVSVDFFNSTLPQSTTNELGTLTLVFSVDAAGVVTLDASTTRGEQIVIDAVDAWDGAVGSIGHSGAFNTSFSLVLDDVGGSGLKLTDNGGGGLGVGGQNAWRIDRPGIEFVSADAIIPDGLLALNSVAWNHRANTTVDMQLTAPGGSLTNSLDGLEGTWNLVGEGLRLQSGQQLLFGNADLGVENDGYALAGFSFDIIDGTVAPETADLTPDNQTSYTTQSFEGRTVWVSDSADGQLYFDVPGAFGFVPGQPVYVRIEYHDSGYGRLFAEYDSTLGDATADKFQDAETHSRSSRVGGGGFVYSYQEFKSPLFNGRQNGGNDFRFKLQSSDGTPLRIAGVQISTAPYADEMFQLALSEPWLEPYAGEVHDLVDNTTLAGKVMTGYQGWFGAPNDVMDSGWNHWGRGSNDKPDESWMTIDAWPYLDDYDAEGLYRAGDLLHQDGRPAYLFSSRDPETVQRHFRWMRKHGIDGAYLQYFVNASRSGANGGKQFVLNNVREAAAKEGRIWALEYDISGLSTDFNEAMDIMTNDWNWMVNEAHITDDPRYAREDGKPVVFIWGFGVRDHSPALANAVVDWFAAQNLYLICGTRWKSEPEWQDHFQRYDQLLIWMERDLGTLASRKAALDSWGMKILPHAWPGFSWNNLQQTVYPYQHTARDGGQFYWDRLYNAVAVGADQIFLGMFDEYDEGTAIMPMQDNHPNIYSEGTNTWGHYIDNEGRDPFWYLQLSEAAREMLNGQRPVSATLPLESEITPAAYAGDDATCYLGTNDVVTGLSHPQPPDGVTDGLVLGNQSCRTNGASYFYFGIDDAMVYANTAGQAATIELEYYDDAPGKTIRLQYDGTSAAYSLHPDVEITPGSGGWKYYRWNVADGYFGNRQNGLSDFRINITGGNTVAIRRVSVFLPEEQGGAQADAPTIEFADTGLAWPEMSDVTGWRLFESGNLASNDWTEVGSGLTFTNGMVLYDALATNEASFYQLRKPAKK
ncbi:hypothetical protein PDESU_01353 [Pontiella desulfatans]|uniref:Uncharacterized protein n=1 Tax=Pontiella desulfatans TaxID=2750659 RepID=A0A6C2TYY7_PONDE|nr:glycoside hydrolase family 71/99-like protein [Pontiella desulfatans]VGO12799.1 hypothetical protein PDESU_01353 [Pontiella desulfatans]